MIRNLVTLPTKNKFPIFTLDENVKMNRPVDIYLIIYPIMAVEYMKGALFGHAFSDSASARLAFLDNLPTKPEIDEAMGLKGGGIWKVSQAQGTDDVELTVELFKALHEYENVECSDVDVGVEEYISKRYIEWFKSRPFDIGTTIKNAFQGATSACSMHENAKAMSANSESNGALMRCIPLAIYAFNHQLNSKDTLDLVKKDVHLTHIKRTVANAVFVYVCILIYLLKNKGQMKDDFETQLLRLADTLEDERIENIVKNYNKPRDYTQNINWDAHGLTLVLYCLMNKLSFRESVRYTLQMGSYTNCSIVGGIMGARHGLSSVPLVDRILNCKPNHGREDFQPKIYADSEYESFFNVKA